MTKYIITAVVATPEEALFDYNYNCLDAYEDPYFTMSYDETMLVLRELYEYYRDEWRLYHSYPIAKRMAVEAIRELHTVPDTHEVLNPVAKRRFLAFVSNPPRRVMF